MNINLVLTICIFEPLASGSHSNSLLGRFGLETQCSDTLSTSAVFVMKLCRVTGGPGGVCEVTWESNERRGSQAKHLSTFSEYRCGWTCT